MPSGSKPGTSSPPDLPPLFIDRNMGGKTVVCTLRKAGLEVQAHDDHFDQAAPDEEWIPHVARQGWVILTKDRKIQHRLSERLAVQDSGARLFALVGKRLGGEAMAATILRAGRRMEKFVKKHRPPFIAKLYTDGTVILVEDFSGEKLP
jgi:hypothetical protein